MLIKAHTVYEKSSFIETMPTTAITHVLTLPTYQFCNHPRSTPLVCVYTTQTIICINLRHGSFLFIIHYSLSIIYQKKENNGDISLWESEKKHGIQEILFLIHPHLFFAFSVTLHMSHKTANFSVNRKYR